MSDKQKRWLADVLLFVGIAAVLAGVFAFNPLTAVVLGGAVLLAAGALLALASPEADSPPDAPARLRRTPQQTRGVFDTAADGFPDAREQAPATEDQPAVFDSPAAPFGWPEHFDGGVR